MSVQAMSWVFDHSASKLGARLVALSVANHADKTGRNARASAATYAEEAHLSVRQARRALRDLVEMGEIRSAGRFVPMGKTGPREDRATVIYEFPGMVDGVTGRHPVEAERGDIVDTDGVTSATERGDIHDPSGVTPVSPKPSLGTVLEPSKEPEALALRADPFDRFWEAFPSERRAARAQCRAKFEAAVAGRKDEPPVDAEAIVAAAIRYRDDPNREPAYTVAPLVWLNQARWEAGPLPPRHGAPRDAAAELAAEAIVEMGGDDARG